MALETQVYQKENNKGFFSLLKDSFIDVKKSLFLARQLAVRDIKSQYRQSYFGIFWAFITPLTTALVWIFLNATGTVRLSDTGVAYPVYAFAGTMLWSVITEAINTPIQSTNAAKSIISKINFPKEALVLSGLYKVLFNTSIKIALLFVFILVFGVTLSWTMALFPLVVIGILLVGTAIGLLITPVGMLYKDVSRAIPIAMQFLMYVTPVVYAMPKQGIMKTLMETNPFTPLITVSRDLLLGITPNDINYYLLVLLVSVFVFLLGLVFYRISIPIFVERMSA